MFFTTATERTKSKAAAAYFTAPVLVLSARDLYHSYTRAHSRRVSHTKKNRPVCIASETSTPVTALSRSPANNAPPVATQKTFRSGLPSSAFLGKKYHRTPAAASPSTIHRP